MNTIRNYLRARPELRIKLRLGWVGYRGAALLMFGLIYVLMGLAVTFNPEPAPGLWHTYLPLYLRIGIWSGAGLIAVVAALLPRWEILGFALLFIGPCERFLSYAGALFGEPSLTRMTGFLVYLFMSAVIVLIAAWPEPSSAKAAIT